MKKCILLLSIMIAMSLTTTALADTTTVDEPFPPFELPTPGNDHHRKYLGLESEVGDSFAPETIAADILLIELFSMYCPYCQKEAPLVNQLYEAMQKYAGKGKVVKIIGLGASNSSFEVDHFRDTYNVPFPLFPDKDMSLYKALKGAGTPGFVGIRLSGDNPRIVLRNSGGFYDANEFLEKLVQQSGM